MKYLLDTHAFLWMVFDDDRLSKTARRVVSNIENTIYISTITYWEISLKYGLGKLELEGVTPEELPHIAQEMSLETLPLSVGEVSTFHRLPRMEHKDPFDRLIIWQAIQRELLLISKDEHFKDYQEWGLKLLW